MNIKANVKELLHNVKLLNGTTKKDDIYYDRLFLIAEGSQLTALAGTRTSFVVINQEIEGLEDGEICVSFSLMNLLKLIKGNEVELKSQKKLSIIDGKGFRSTLSLIDIASVYDRIKVWHNGLSEDYIELNTSELKDLARASLDFPSFQESRWVEIILCAEESFGSIQANEIGSVDRYQFSDVSGNTLEGSSLVFNPESLISLLNFCGNRCRISLSEAKKIPSCISDPDNSNWYSLITQSIVPQGMKTE